jgi:hypothetical protein
VIFGSKITTPTFPPAFRVLVSGKPASKIERCQLTGRQLFESGGLKEDSTVTATDTEDVDVKRLLSKKESRGHGGGASGEAAAGGGVIYDDDDDDDDDDESFKCARQQHAKLNAIKVLTPSPTLFLFRQRQ